MDSLLLNGRYTKEEAELLLSRLFKVKTDFHLARIDTSTASEEDIEHSERRILELEEELTRLSNQARNSLQ